MVEKGLVIVARRKNENPKTTERQLRGDRLRFLREQMELSQPEMDKLLGFGNGVTSRYENSNADPLPTQLAKMSKILDVSVDWLLGLTDNPEVITGFKTPKKPDIQQVKEKRFLDRLHRGEIMELINDLSSDAISRPPDQDSTKYPPEQKAQ